MPIRVTCSCGKVLQGRDEDAGRQARCPACGNVLTLAASTEEEQPWPPTSAPSESESEDLPLRMATPPASTPPATSGSKPGKRYTCHVCEDKFAVDDVYEDGDDYICKRCHEREPPRKSSRYSSRRRYDDDDDDYGPRRRRRREHVDNNLIWAILVTLFCCWPAGIVAIVYAAQVDGHVARGDIEDARRAAGNAATWCWIAFIGTFVIGFFYIVMIAAAGGR